ncbi:MAG: protein kinase [Gemmatimonadota bacterium]|nr:MAG: protein kinase [Gemmatimonadota bacterium]
MIELITLGRAAIQRDGVDCDVTQHRQKVALLSYLALEGPVAREHLLSVFWPGREEEKARHSLSQALYGLKKELGSDLVGATPDRISLMPGTVKVDVQELEDAGQADHWEQVVELYHGPFLDQFHLAETPGFEEWQTRTRAWVGGLARRAFVEVIASRAVSDDLAGALDLACRWTRIEPLEDEAQHALIALLAMSGDRAAALAQFEAYTGRLARELQVEPLEATAALVDQIRAGGLPLSPLIGEALPAKGKRAVVERAWESGPPAGTEAVPGQFAAGEPERLLAGELAPRLQIVRQLGESSTASVYLAREPELRRQVAVKVFAPQLAKDRRARLRFEREVQAVASLTQANIVGLHWAGALSNNLPYFVMEYVEGRSMANKLRAEGRLPVAEARRVLADVASALAAAHRRGIIHRDVQPANVLCEEETGRTLLADFGVAAMLSKTGERAVSITESGELVGDPRWMSPEQLVGAGATERSDVYSLGLLGYEVLAGRGPYDAGSRQEQYAAQIKEQPRKLKELRPDVDADLAELLERCLAKDPSDRPDAGYVARMLSAPPDEAWVAAGAGRATPRRVLSALLERRVPHALAAYLAGGFVLVELVGEMVSRRLLAEVFDQLSLLTYALGAPAVATFAWFHGKPGRQRFQYLEYWLLSLLVLVWLAFSVTILLR